MHMLKIQGVGILSRVALNCRIEFPFHGHPSVGKLGVHHGTLFRGPRQPRMRFSGLQEGLSGFLSGV